MTINNILGIIVIGVICIIILLAYSRLKKRKFNWRAIWEYAIIVILIVFGVIGLEAIYIDKNASSGLIGIFGHSLTFNILTIFGITLTAVGLFLTHYQLKMNEDRIHSYDELYEALFKLLDKENKKRTKFRLYGPTIIPGHVMYENAKDITKYKTVITGLYSDELITKRGGTIEFITLNDDLSEEAYKNFNGKNIGDKLCIWDESDEHESMNHDKKRGSSNGDKRNNDTINLYKKIKKLKSLKREIRKNVSLYQSDNEEHIKTEMIEAEEPTNIPLISDYYISDGHTVIYVKPLHYMENINTENAKDTSVENAKNADASTLDRKKISPELVGFKTADRFIVKAFEENFMEMKKKIEKSNENMQIRREDEKKQKRRKDDKNIEDGENESNNIAKVTEDSVT